MIIGFFSGFANGVFPSIALLLKLERTDLEPDLAELDLLSAESTGNRVLLVDSFAGLFEELGGERLPVGFELELVEVVGCLVDVSNFRETNDVRFLVLEVGVFGMLLFEERGSLFEGLLRELGVFVF